MYPLPYSVYPHYDYPYVNPVVPYAQPLPADACGCGCSLYPKSRPIQVLEEAHPVVAPKINAIEEKDNSSPSAVASAQTVVNVGMGGVHTCNEPVEPAACNCAKPVLNQPPVPCSGYYPQPAAYNPYYPSLR